MKQICIHAALITLAGLSWAAATQQPTACKEPIYENHNQVEPRPLTVHVARGTVTDPQHVPIPQACIAVFTANDHRLVATTETDDQGRFSLKDIQPGEYRLLAKYDSFCTPNILVRITKHRKRKTLQVHMKTPALDSCSYIDLAGDKPKTSH